MGVIAGYLVVFGIPAAVFFAIYRVMKALGNRESPDGKKLYSDLSASLHRYSGGQLDIVGQTMADEIHNHLLHYRKEIDK
jgi:hypothetical protein